MIMFLLSTIASSILDWVIVDRREARMGCSGALDGKVKTDRFFRNPFLSDSCYLQWLWRNGSDIAFTSE